MTTVTIEDLNEILREAGITEAQAKAFAKAITKSPIDTDINVNVSHLQKDIDTLEGNIQKISDNLSSVDKKVAIIEESLRHVSTKTDIEKLKNSGLRAFIVLCIVPYLPNIIHQFVTILNR